MEKIYGRTKTIQEDKVSGFCPGCMHSTVIKLIGEVLEEMDLVDRAACVLGIGCCGLHMDYIAYDNTTAPHGRACAVATGMKRSNPDSLVFTYQGDGDLSAIGTAESIHAAARGENVVAIYINNAIYGMTGGQFSATTPSGKLTKTSPLGNPERAFDLCALTAAAGANFVARETVRPGRGLTRILRSGLENKGFSLIEVVSPCTTLFGPRNGFAAPLDMLVWLQAHGVKRQTYERLDDPEATGHFATGVLVERHEPDFLSRYEAMRRLAAPSGESS